MEHVLEIRDVLCAVGDDLVIAVDHLVLDAGGVSVLNAPSGWGKSTVLGLAGGVIPPSNSDAIIRLKGVDMTPDRAGHRYAGPRELGFVLQTHGLLPFLTLGQNVLLPLEIDGGEIDRAWMGFVARTLGIADLLDRKPSQVSQGQRQRAGIARAFAAKPSLLLLDEPVSALDAANAAGVEGLISLLAEEMNAAVLMASHRVHASAFERPHVVTHSLNSRVHPAVITFAEIGTDSRHDPLAVA